MTIWRYIGLIFLSLVLILATVIGFAPTWLRLGLTLYGADDVSFRSLEIGLERAELTDLTIGDPATQTVERISLDYALSGLIRGHIDRVAISGLNASLELDKLIADDAEQTPIAIPAGTFVEELVLEGSRIELATSGGQISIPLAGQFKTIDDRLTFELAAEGTHLADGEGKLQADLAIKGMLPLDDGPVIDRLVASGDLSIQAKNASVPGLVQGLAGDGLIAFEFENGKLEAWTDQLKMTVARLPFDTGPLETPWLATLGTTSNRIRLTGRKDRDNWQIAIAGPLALDTKSGALMTELDLRAALDGEGRLSSLDHVLVSLDMSDIAWNGARLDSGKSSLTVNGVNEALKGRLVLDVEGVSWSDASHVLDDATLQQELDLAFDGRTLDLSIAENGRISIGKLASTDQFESGWFTVRLFPDDAPLLSIDTHDGGWSSRLAAELDPVRLETPSGQWWARIENLAIAAKGNSAGPKSGQIVVKQGRADLPSANLALIGIESDVQLSAHGLAADQSVPLIIRAIRPLDEPRWFAPLRLDAILQPTSAALPVSGSLATRAKPGTEIDFSGTYDVQSGEGNISFDLPELTFSQEGLQPVDLSPELQNTLSDTSGRLALNGEIQWGENGHTSSADILVEELGLSIGPARLERVNSLLHFDSLIPLTMKDGQELAIGLLNVGLPLTDGLVAMKLDADGEFAVDRLTWRFADGQVRAEPFTFGSDVQELTMTLDVDQLDLDELLELTQLDGLSGEGVIDGTLPLTISETGVMIADGTLEATGDGVLRYQPDQAPGLLQTGGESVGLMLRALENFHYDKLRITLDGRTDGDTKIGLHVSGANPDLYEGHPIEFNLDLEGDLANLVRTNISNYQIPDRIREQLQGFGK